MRGLEAAAADLADRHRRHHVGDARANRGLARGILAATGGEHLTHDDLGHLVGLDSGLREQSLDDMRAQIGGGNLGQRPAEFSDGSSQCGYDDNLVHVHALL